MKRILEELRETLKGLLSIPIQSAANLTQISRFLHEKWALPVSDLAIVVLVESASVSPVLGSLALGFPTASHPPLPIQGSKRADKFFSQGLRKGKGNFYLAIQDATALSKLGKFLEERGS